MKKFMLVMLTVGFILSIQAQQDQSFILKNNNRSGSRETLVYDCLPGTKYFHSVVDWVALASCAISPNYRVYDQIETTLEPVNELKFFGVDDDNLPSRTFEIQFFHDNAGAPGTVFYSDVVNLSYAVEGSWVKSYVYAIEPEITLVSGDWISVYSLDETSWWFWTVGSGGDGCVLQPPNGTRCDYGDVAFCLGRHMEIPVSPWAIALGIGFIAVAVVLRTRRMI